MSADSVIKLRPEAKDMVRYAAAIFQLTQADFVERAVADYVVAHQEDMNRRIEELRERVKSIVAATPKPADS